MHRFFSFLMFFLIFLFANQAICQDDSWHVSRDTIIVYSSLNETTTIKYNGVGWGGGNGGGSPRIRITNYSIKDTLNRVIYCGFIYARQERCISETPMAVHFKYNEDDSYVVLTIREGRIFRKKYRTDYYDKNGRSASHKKSRKLSKENSEAFGKVISLRTKCY